MTGSRGWSKALHKKYTSPAIPQQHKSARGQRQLCASRGAGFTKTKHRALAAQPSRSAQHEPRSIGARDTAPTAAVGDQPSGGGERQPGGVPRAAAAGLGGHDRRAEPLAQRVLAAHDDPATACGLGARAASDAGRPGGASAAALLPDPLRRIVRRRAARCGVRRGRALFDLRDPVGAGVHEAGHPVRCAVRREHRSGAAPAGARTALAGAAPRGVRGRPLGQRRTPRARVGGERGGRARAARGPRVGARRSSTSADRGRRRSAHSRSATRGAWSRARG